MAQFDFSQSIEACAAHYGEEADEVRQYLTEGQERALALDNRGPIRFQSDGALHDDVQSAYSRFGFYVFEGVLGKQELADIEEDIQSLRARFPLGPESKVDSQGRPAVGVDCEGPGLLWAKPLSDPLGGTDIANGRHQVKLRELNASEGAPAAAPFVLMGSLQFSEAALRLYGHPELLKVAAAVNGDDFAPFNEVLFIKDPGVGAAVSWHQDGDTHWENPKFDEGIHGFNFMAQLYGSTPVNGVWVVPGTHKQGRLDIKQMVAASGSERLQNAVPMVCNPGDVIICNRQLVHGSFANSGYEPRLTLNFGFHRRSSVLGVRGAGIHSPVSVYSTEVIEKRAEMIAYAVDARHQKYPEEKPYEYQPAKQAGHNLAWDESAARAVKDYNLLDLSI